MASILLKSHLTLNLTVCVWEPGMFYCQEGCQLPACQVMLNKARALYLVRVSVTCEIIDRREKGGVGG